MKCRVRSGKQLDRIRKNAVHELSPVAITAMLTVCKDRLRFGYDKVRKAAEHICYYYDSINQDYISFEDLKECLADDDGVDIPFDFDHLIEYYTEDGAVNAAAYAQKAFSCAVLCTVLCDKFGFGKVKAQQAVKQFCSVFEALRNNRSRLSELQKAFYEGYEIYIY